MMSEVMQVLPTGELTLMGINFEQETQTARRSQRLISEVI
jgi:hypothetical protein